MTAPITRRSLLRASSVTLGAAMLPIGLAAATPPAIASPAVFDPAAFLDDLTAAGYGVTACRNVPRPGCAARPPSYAITSPQGSGFGAAYTAVIVRWGEPMDTCPSPAARCWASQRPRSASSP